MSTSHNHFNRPAGPENAMRYEQASMRYVDAYDRDDLAVMAQLWHEAETDARLEQILCELNEGLLQENEMPGNESSQDEGIENLHRKLPAGSTDSSPLTVGDVAAAIVADRMTFTRLSAADRAFNESLLNKRTALPSKMDGGAVMLLKSKLSITASQQYWRAFQQAAILINMSRAGAGRAAARQVKPSRSSKREQRGEK